MHSVEELISIVLDDIRIRGYSTQMPFDIGEVEQRMMDFAAANGILLGSNRLFMTAKQLQHTMRRSKQEKGLAVSSEELIHFPNNRYAMDLYYDGECFIYTNGISKFIVHPNYEIKISKDKMQVVNFITATRIKDRMEFNGKRYIKI